MDWSFGLEPWSGVLEWILGVEPWSEMLELKRNIKSGGKMVSFERSHSKPCNKCITHINNVNRWLISVTYPILVQFIHLLHTL